MVLESHLESPSTASVQSCNGSCSNKLMMETFDEPRVGVGEVIFVMGGYDGVTWLPTVDCYSPSRGVVKSVKPMDSVRSYASATVLNGLIYNIGGWNGYDNQWCDTGMTFIVIPIATGSSFVQGSDTYILCLKLNVTIH